jgi:FKBP-type peptidyl-prolyl cis-trans isomerase FkpA
VRGFILFLAATTVLAQSPVAKPSSASAPPKVPGQVAPTTSMTDDEKAIYAIGLSIYRSLGQLSLSPAELAIVEKAMNEADAGKPAIDLAEWGPKIQGFARTRADQAKEKEKTRSVAYLTKAAAEPGAIKTDSGLIYRELRAGTGASPKATDSVKVNYRGTLVDGTEFDSSYSRNEPAQFSLGGVIPCWTEGVQKMKVGGKASLVCPANLAYGENGQQSIPGGATLVFEIELLEISGAAQ